MLEYDEDLVRDSERVEVALLESLDEKRCCWHRSTCSNGRVEGNSWCVEHIKATSTTGEAHISPDELFGMSVGNLGKAQA